MKKTTHLLAFQAALIIALNLSIPVHAGETTNQTTTLSAKDLKFVHEASTGGEMEVTLGRLAAQAGTDAGVRDFANRMIQDHQKANQELSALVSEKGWSVPANDPASQNKMMEKLQSLQGSAFDKAYMKNMVADHKEDIAVFQHEIDRGDNAELRAWASKTLPTLKEHLAQAQAVKEKLSGTMAKQ